jgi:IS4 transposase
MMNRLSKSVFHCARFYVMLSPENAAQKDETRRVVREDFSYVPNLV